MVMKIKAFVVVVVVVVVACQKQKSTGGSKEHNFLSEYEYSTGCPNLMWRRLQYSSPRHISQNSRGIFCPLNVGFCKFSCQTQKNLNGGGKEHNFLSEIWVQQGVFQLGVTRIAGRWGTPLRWGTPHIHIISSTVTPTIK